MPRLLIPGDTTNVSDNWDAHRARGSLGGTDFTDGRGTTMRAMAPGVVTIVDNSPDGSGGRYVQIRLDDGSFIEELHATAVTAVRGQRVGYRGALGISGGSGYGSDYYYGPHIHAHGITPQGVRYNLEPYIDWANPTSLAGNGGGTLITEGEDSVLSFIILNSGADNDLFTVNQRLVLDHATGILRALYDGEYALLEKTHPEIVWAEWSPNTAKGYIARGGFRAYDVPPKSPKGHVGVLTGEIIYSATDRRYLPVRAVNAGEVTISDTVAKKIADAVKLPDLTKVLDAIAKVPSAVLTAFGLKRA